MVCLSDVSIFDTAVGVIVALAVNYYLPREKVVPLWEEGQSQNFR